MMAEKLKGVYQINGLPTSLNLDFPEKSILKKIKGKNVSTLYILL